MKNPYDILHQKECELSEVLREIAALRIVIRLLAEESDEDTLETKSEATPA